MVSVKKTGVQPREFDHGGNFAPDPVNPLFMPLLVGLVQFRLHENVWTENFLTQPPLLVVSRHLFALSFKVKGICFEQPAKKLKSLNFSSFNMQINFATNEQPCPYLAVNESLITSRWNKRVKLI